MTVAGPPPTALIDETQSGDEYLLAAVVVSEPRRAALRDEALALRMSGGKLHWHHESAARRTHLVRQLSVMAISSVAVVRTASAAEGVERSRRKCLEGLLVELDRRDVDHASLRPANRARTGATSASWHDSAKDGGCAASCGSTTPPVPRNPCCGLPSSPARCGNTASTACGTQSSRPASRSSNCDT